LIENLGFYKLCAGTPEFPAFLCVDIPVLEGKP